MPPTFTPTEVTAALTAVEQQADRAGWGVMPVLYALAAAPGAPRTVDVVRVGIDESFWREDQSIIELGLVPIWAPLSAVINLFLFERDWLPVELESPTHPLIGFAFLHEIRDTSVLDDDPGATPLRVRVLIGYDRHGCVYEIRRVRGTADPIVTALTGASLDQLPLLITKCLQPLAAALCAPPY